MSKKLFIPKRKGKVENLEDTFLTGGHPEERVQQISIQDIYSDEANPYPLTELQDLIESIQQFGLEHNLTVQRDENGKYRIVSGHRRFAAIQEILKNDLDGTYEELEYIYCKVISKNTNEIVTQLRLHEANFQNRNLLKLKEEDKLKIVEDYLHWLDRARKENVLINGKEIKGKTREILAERFNMDVKTAQKLITKIKQGVQSGHPLKKEKSVNEKVHQIVNQLDKINEKVSEIIEQLDDTQIKQIKSSFDAIHEILMLGK